MTAGFLLPQFVSHQFAHTLIFDGILGSFARLNPYTVTRGGSDGFDRQVKPIKDSGEKYTDGDGMYLLVTPIGKYWRLDYRYLGKRKTLALGVYASTTLAKARIKRGLAKAQLADGIDPGLVRREDKLHRSEIANQTFARVALTWLSKTENERAATTQEKIAGWIQKDLLPYLGPLPISTLKPRDTLVTVQRIEARGAIESAHRVRQICDQVLRFAVASGLVEHDVSADLKGALATPQKTNYAAITDPKRVGELMGAIYGYKAIPMRLPHSNCQRCFSSVQVNYALQSGRKSTSKRPSGAFPHRR
jgi:hypothetical protein